MPSSSWRFLFGALLVLVLPRPEISWKALAGTGIFLFAGQFVFLFLAMQSGLPPGLTSVLVQLQGPLTLVVAAFFLGERATGGQWAGLGVAMVGVIVIAHSVEGSASLVAVGLALLSALSWAVGNLFLRETRAPPVLSVTAWASLVPPLPLLAAGLLHDGWSATMAPILAPTLAGLVRPLLHGRTGDVGRLPRLGHPAAHLSGRQGRADLPASALLRLGFLQPAYRRDGGRLAISGNCRSPGRSSLGHFGHRATGQ